MMNKKHKKKPYIKGQAKKRYEYGERHREPFLNRARKSAKLTIPSLLPKEGHNKHSRLPVPGQSIGARGLNALASKLLLALFPPNTPFFQLKLDDEILAELEAAGGRRTDVEEAVTGIERSVHSEFIRQAFHVSLVESLKHLLVSGSGLLHLTDEVKLKHFRLDKFVVFRDPVGNVLEIVVKETVSPLILDEAFRQQIEDSKELDSDKKQEQTVDIYTHVQREAGGDWSVYQEVKGMIVPASKGTYPEDKCPWIALRLNAIDDEDYGRGYIEEYYGDLHSVDALQKALLSGAKAAARLLVMVNPNGTTKVRDITKAENGDVISGEAKDISFLQLDKFADFRFAKEVWSDLIKQLSYVFLLNSTVQRAGERVTAEEIRYVATELEDTASGIYSILSQELQLRLIQALLHRMQKDGKIPTLPEGVRPSITTGMEALGRGHDLQRLDTFIQGANSLIGPEAVQRRLNEEVYFKRRGMALGVDIKDLIKTDEQVAQEQQQQLQQQMEQMTQQTLTSGGMDMAKDAVKEGMKANAS